MDCAAEVLFSYTSFCLLVHFLIQWEKFFSYMEVRTEEDGNLVLRLTDNLSIFGISVHLKPPVFRVRTFARRDKGRKRTSFPSHCSVILLSNFLNLHKVMYSTSTLWTFPVPGGQKQEGCTIKDPNSGQTFLRFKPGSVHWPSSWNRKDDSTGVVSKLSGPDRQAVILQVPDLIHTVSAVCLLESAVSFVLDENRLLLKSRSHDGEIAMRICSEVSQPIDDVHDGKEEKENEFQRQVNILSGPLKAVLSSMSKCRFVHVSTALSEEPYPTRRGAKKKRKGTSLFRHPIEPDVPSLKLTCIINQIKCCFHFRDSSVCNVHT
jgi:hypothetical protein